MGKASGSLAAAASLTVVVVVVVVVVVAGFAAGRRRRVLMVLLVSEIVARAAACRFAFVGLRFRFLGSGCAQRALLGLRRLFFCQIIQNGMRE